MARFSIQRRPSLFENLGTEVFDLVKADVHVLRMTMSNAIELRDLLLKEFPVDDDRAVHAEGWKQFHNRERRERIAGLALQGLLTADPFTNFADAAEDAIGYADALVAALDKES